MLKIFYKNFVNLFQEKDGVVSTAFGYLKETAKKTDFIFGGERQAQKVILQTDRNYMPFLVEHEKQKKGFDSYSCVSFAANNCIEILLKRQYGFEVNLSDRFLASMSDTIPNKGNYMSRVADALRHYGAVLEDEYPWGGINNSQYLLKPSKDIQEKGLAFVREYDIQYEWVDTGGVDPHKLYDALVYGPVQVSVNSEATYTGARSKKTDHVVTVVSVSKYKSFTIFDHYNRKTYTVPWNFYFGAAMLFTIRKKNKIELVQVYGKPEIYAVETGVAMHIADWESYEYGQKVGFWDHSTLMIITQSTFERKYILGNTITLH